MENTPSRNTLNWFRELSHVDDADTGLKYCVPAINSLQSRVRNSNMIVDNIPELYFAAAVLAYYRFSITDEFTHYSTFKAGDVRLDMEPEKFKATLTELLNLSLSDAAPYLKTGVKFKSIGGV